MGRPAVRGGWRLGGGMFLSCERLHRLATPNDDFACLFGG